MITPRWSMSAPRPRRRLYRGPPRSHPGQSPTQPRGAPGRLGRPHAPMNDVEQPRGLYCAVMQRGKPFVTFHVKRDDNESMSRPGAES